MKILLAGVFAVITAAGLSAQASRTPEETAILAADTAFDQAVADRSVDRFLALIADDATFAGGGEPARGHDAIRAGWARYFEAGGPTLRWTPRTAHVLTAGRDVGVTTGSWVLRATDANGRPTEARGEYLTVWRKQADGAWRAVFDTGSQVP